LAAEVPWIEWPLSATETPETPVILDLLEFCARAVGEPIQGVYPPKRGTLLTISETEGVLYTRGTVDFYKTYPGMYVPNPLKITVYEQDLSLESLCDEILGLTKMNWNNTQMDGRLPITLECARKIGDIMKYVSPTEKPQVSYSFYMLRFRRL
jgi:hypothetical protein